MSEIIELVGLIPRVLNQQQQRCSPSVQSHGGDDFSSFRFAAGGGRLVNAGLRPHRCGAGFSRVARVR
jgi:hypothetical protein